MASNLIKSLSESLKVALTNLHRENPNGHPKLYHNDTHLDKSNITVDKYLEKSGTRPNTVLPRCVQCLLVMAFISIEMSATFTWIYLLLFLQFLGVPVSLLTIGGTIGGGLSFMLLPITGYFSDRGANLVIRKMKMIFISLAFHAAGFTGLAVCSALRLNIIDTSIISTTTNTVTTEPPTFSDLIHLTTGHDNDTASLHTHVDNNISQFMSNSADEYNTLDHSATISNSPIHENISAYSIGAIQIVGIISAGLLDAGFDTGMSLCRAYILEVTPTSIHNQLLIMATVFSALGGFTMSSIGLIDFPDILGPTFGVDGTAATVLMFCCIIMTLMVLGFVCTVITGYVVYKKNKYLFGDNEGGGCSQYGNGAELQKDCQDGTDKHGLPTRRTNVSTARINSNPTKPLLAGNSIDSRNYSSLVGTSVGDYVEHKTMCFGELNTSGSIKNQSVLAPCTRNFAKEGKSNNERMASEPQDSNDHYDESNNDDYGDDYDNDVDNDNVDSDDIIDTDCKGSHHTINSVLSNDNMPTQTEGQSIFKCNRLKFLLLAVFFTFGANLCHTGYSGNTLTIGVYHGDPLAREGTRERDNYNKGTQRIALGNVIMYCAFSIVSLLNTRVIDLVGEKVYYVICQLGFGAAYMSFILTEMEQFFFIMCGVSGFYRACAFTVGYIMVNDLVKEETSKRGGDPAKHIGKIMAMIGFLLPSIYTLMSIMVGPLMAALDSVWVPMVIAVIMNGLALTAFCLFIVTKS